MPVISKRANRLIFLLLTLLSITALVGTAVAEKWVGGGQREGFNAEAQRRRGAEEIYSNVCMASCAINSSLIYSTYLGGELTDMVQGMAVDGLGRVTFVGTTQSVVFPDNSQVAKTNSPEHGVDAFVGRLSADGSTLDYLFWFNAVNAADVDEGLGLALDRQGNAIVTGHTRSADFCTVFGTVPGYDSSYNGNGDAFVLKVKENGSGLAYCTFLGGGDWDSGTAVAVDSAGNVSLTGGTWSADFPVTADALASEPYGLRDLFLARLDADGNLTYATFLGGGGQEQGEAIALDDQRAVITGWTNSVDLPTTADGVQTESGGNFDAFVIILDEDNRLDYATYLGGVDEDRGAAVAMGTDGMVIVGGSTRSAEWQTRPAFTNIGADKQESQIGTLNGFIAGFVPSESNLHYQTVLGGMGDDRVAGVAVDAPGNVFVTGDTQSADFPGSHGAMLNGGQDSFLAILSPFGNLLYSQLVGGSDWERGMAIALGADGSIHLGGGTRSADFPTTPDAFDTTLNDDYDAYIMKQSVMIPPSSSYQLFLPIVYQ